MCWTSWKISTHNSTTFMLHLVSLIWRDFVDVLSFIIKKEEKKKLREKERKKKLEEKNQKKGRYLNWLTLFMNLESSMKGKVEKKGINIPFNLIS